MAPYTYVSIINASRQVNQHLYGYLEAQGEALHELGVESGVLREVHDELGRAEEGGHLVCWSGWWLVDAVRCVCGFWVGWGGGIHLIPSPPSSHTHPSFSPTHLHRVDLHARVREAQLARGEVRERVGRLPQVLARGQVRVGHEPPRGEPEEGDVPAEALGVGKLGAAEPPDLVPDGHLCVGGCGVLGGCIDMQCVHGHIHIHVCVCPSIHGPSMAMSYLERRGPREEHLQLEAEEVVADHHVGVLRLQAGEEPG